MHGKAIELSDSRNNSFRAYLSLPNGGRGPGDWFASSSYEPEAARIAHARTFVLFDTLK